MAKKIKTLGQMRKSARVMMINKEDIEMFDENAVVVIQYAGWMYIELLVNAEYCLILGREIYKSRNLKQLERILWYDFAVDELLTNDDAIKPQLIKKWKFDNKRDYKRWCAEKVIYRLDHKKYEHDGSLYTKKELKQYFYETFKR